MKASIRPNLRWSDWAALGLVVSLLFIPGAIGLLRLMNLWPDHDFDYAVEREGVAIVRQLLPERATWRGNIEPGRAVVEFEGQRYGVRRGEGFTDLQVGKEARIFYRVGKSGRIWVDKVSPLTPSGHGETVMHR